MHGKVCVITGATSGIGQVAAERLAGLGASLVLVARDPARGEATLARLRALAPGGRPRIHYADLSLMAETAAAARRIAETEPRIDLLINAAGAIATSRRETAERLEYTFALNHMSYFLMVHGLRAGLAASAPARIVNVASIAHRGHALDFADLQAKARYSAIAVYGRSKLANILFTRELARRLAGTGVTANCLHPGFVATRFGDNGGPLFRTLLGIAKRLFAISPAKGGAHVLHAATAPELEGVTGAYLENDRIVAPSPQGRDDAAAARLWDESLRLAGLAR